MRSDRRATALLVVMVVVVMMALAAYGFLHIMQTEYRSSAFARESAEARCACLSGQDYVLAWLRQSRARRYELLQSMPSQQQFAGIPLEMPTGQEPSEQWSFSVLSATTSVADQASWQFGLQNESAKLNLRALGRWEEQQPGQAKLALMAMPGMSETQAMQILASLGIRSQAAGPAPPSTGDQIAPDARPNTTNSAPNSAPNPATNPAFLGAASTASGLPRSLAELVTRGAVTEAQMWGNDRDRNYSPDDFASALVSVDAANDSPLPWLVASVEFDLVPVVPWASLLTLHSAERNETFDGQPRIWLNQPDLAKLEQELLKSWPSDWVNFVIAYRQFGPASEPLESTVAAGQWSADISSPAAVTIESPLDLIGVTVAVSQADGTQAGLQSPFEDGPTSFGNYIHQLLDDVSIAPSPVIEGRVNVLEATSEVLAAVPGIDVALADKIVQQRQESAARPADRRSIGWLLSEQVVDLSTMQQLLPNLTVGGDVYRGQVIGFRDDRSTVVRMTAAFAGLEKGDVLDVQNWHAWGRGFTSAELREGPRLENRLSENPLP